MSAKKTISGTISRHLAMLVTILVIPLGAYWVGGSYLTSMREIEEQEGRLIDAQRDTLRRQVSRAVDLIEYKKSLIDSQMRDTIRERTVEAHAVATHLYDEYAGKKSLDEIKKLAREALRPVRFSGGRGYYFAVALDGSSQLSADRSEMEGDNLLNLQDARGNYVVREMIEIVRKSGEGYCRYFWTKPGSTRSDFEKVAYVKRFAPFGWLIGTGDYVDEVEKDLKDESLAWVARMRFGRDGRVFVGQWDGLSLVGPDKGRNTIDVTDSRGVRIVQEYIDLAKRGKGFLSYLPAGADPKTFEPRIAYVDGVPGWQWYVGAGANTSDILAQVATGRKEAMAKVRRRIGEILLFLGAVFLAGQLSARYVSRRLRLAFDAFFDFFRRAASELVEIDLNKLGFVEFENLARSANRMIAERHEAERAVKVREERLELAMEIVHRGVWDFDLRNGTVHFSPRWFTLIQHEVGDFDPTLETWADLVHPDERKGFEAGMAKLMGTGEPFNMEYRMRTRDGQWTWILTRGRCFERDPQDKPSRVIGTNAGIGGRKQAEIALQESNEYFRTLISNISDVILIVDDRFVVKYASPNVERHFGWTPEDLVGSEGWTTVHPADLTYVREEIRGLAGAPAPSPRTLQYRYLRKDGTYRTIELVAVGMMDNPRVGGILMNFRDITRRKRTAEALVQSEKRYRTLVDSLPIGLAVTTVDDYVLQYSNKRFEEILGWSKEAMRTREDFEEHVLPDPESRAQMRERMGADIASGDPDRMRWPEVLMTRADGKQAYVSSQLIPLLDMGVWMWVFWDVTDRKRAQDGLRESEEKVRLLLDSTAEAIFGLDLAGRLTMANPSCIRLLGYTSRDQLIGRSMHDLIHHSHADGSPYPARECRILSALAHGEPCHVDDEVLWRADGTSFAAEYWSHPVLHDGLVVGCVVTFMDITERLRTEDERRNLEAQLRHSQKMEAVGQLAGGVAHDFNNLLQVISGYADIAAQMLAPGKAPEPEIQEVLKATQRATTLVRQLLAFSRREMLHPEYVNLNDLVGGITKMLRRLIGEHIELITSPGYELKAVYADPGQIEQVLMNLCVNARDAMPKGGRITIETANVSPDGDFAVAHPEARMHDLVMFSVSDTGIGIAPELHERVFEPFFTTKEVGRGTGLGLATVYGIVKQHDGLIDFESVPGHGTTFRIYLPAAVEPSNVALAQEPPSHTSGGSETILLAEDDVMVSQLAQAILERAGYRVVVARDGSQAIAVFDKDPGAIDLALLDVVMPKMSGRAVANHIRSRRPSLPVIFCSGYDFNVLESSLSEGERHPLLRKPYSPTDLLAGVREALASAPPSDAQTP